MVRVAVVVGAGIEQEENPFPDSRHRGMLKAAIQKVLFVIATKNPILYSGWDFLVNRIHYCIGLLIY